MYKIVNAIDKIANFKEAKAHCDVPCGIYDPITAQISALSTIRMADLMNELDKTGEKNLECKNKMVRYIVTKEEHAEKAKHEIRVIWGDFLKEQHFKKYPQLDGLVHKIMEVGSKVRQSPEREVGVELLDLINQFAEIFWEIKGYKTKKAKAPYAPALDLVYPEL